MMRALPWTLTGELRDAYRQVLADWPVPHAERHLATRWGSTFVLACGDEHAPPLVLLHGAQANTAAWLAEAAAWSRHFRVWMVDLVGEAGLSARDRPAGGAQDYVQWLDEVLDALGVTRTALVGMSYGGWVALEYTLHRPARVERLALLCPAGIGRQRPFMLKALPLLLLGHRGAARLRRMVMGPPPEHVPDEARPVIALFDRIMREVRPRTAPIPVVTDAALATLRLPVLAIVGGKDPLLDSFDTVRRLARCVRQAQVAMLPDAHHYLPGQQERVLRFLLD